MKKLFSLVAILLFAFACGPLPQEHEAESAVGITAPDGYSVLCITGFTRLVPHICSLLTATPTSFSTTQDNTCRSFDLSSGSLIVPSSTKFIEGIAAIQINSGNAVVIRNTSLSWFLDASCVTQYSSTVMTIREMVATVAGTELTTVNTLVRIPLVSQRIYYKAFSSGGTGSLSSLVPTAYYD